MKWSTWSGDVARDEHGALYAIWSFELREDMSAARCKGCGREEDLPAFSEDANHAPDLHMELIGKPGAWVEVPHGLPAWDAAIQGFVDRHRACQWTEVNP